MKNTIQSDLIRGHINTIILKALYDGDRYSYDIIREIEQKSSGQYKLKQPTLYSCLKRLEIQGFIRSYWGAKSNGGRRKYFTLTEMGRELFIKNQSEWEYSRTVIDKLISDKEVDLSAASPIAFDNDEESEELAEEYSDESFEDDAESENELTEDEVSEEYDSEDKISENDEEVDEEENSEDIEESEIDNDVSDQQEETDLNEQEEEHEAQQEVAAASEPEQPPISFADTSAIMDELFKMQQSENSGGSYVDKIVADEYVSDRTDEGISANLYFKDFLDEEEAVREAIQAVQNEDEEQQQPMFQQYYPSQQPTPSAPEPQPIPAQPVTPQPVEESVRQQAPEQPSNTTNDNEAHGTTDNGFLDYHTAKIIPEPDNIIIQREYRSILGEFLNPCFIERTPPQPEYTPPPQPEPTVTQEPVAESQQPEAPQIAEEDAVTETNEQYTTDADINRKLNSITDAVRQMGDNVTIRTHNSSSAQEYNSAYHYYSNKLMLAHYGILFAVMMVEILFTAVFVNLVLKAGKSSDTWVYIIATITAVIFPVVAFIKNFNAPDKQKRINFNLKNSLIYRFIVLAQCLLIIYCANVIAGMPLGFSIEYVTTLLLPSLMSLCFPISALIFNSLYKTRKYMVEQ